MSVLFSDTFTDTNGTRLATHNAAWQVADSIGVSELQINGNALVQTAANVSLNLYGLVNVGTGNVDMTATVTAGSATGWNFAMLTRCPAPSPPAFPSQYVYYAVNIKNNGSVTVGVADSASGQTLGSFALGAGTFTVRAISLADNTHTLLINGTTIATHTYTGNPTNPYVGLIMFQDGTGLAAGYLNTYSVDNFVVNGFGGLLLPAPMNGIGAGGPFFRDPLS